MGYISMDTWTSLQTDREGKIVKVTKEGAVNKGQPVPIAELRVRVTEGDNTELFTLDKWRKVVMTKGNEFQINSAFTAKNGNRVPARIVKLSPNGIGDDLSVKKGDEEWTTYHLQSGLAESFASVCEQTEIASENWQNIKADKKKK